MDAERDAEFARGRHDLADPRRQHAAVRVAEHDDLRTGLGCGTDYLQRVRRILAVSVKEVLAVDEDPLAFGPQMPHRVADHCQVFREGGVQRLLDVTVMALGHDASYGGARVPECSG